MNTSQFMDKQIMDLSASASVPGSSPPSKSVTTTHDFMADDDDHQDHVTDGGVIDVKNDEILPSYDFQPLRPSLGYAPNLNLDSSNVSAGGGGGSVRVWNSVDLKASVDSTTALRSYGLVDSVEPAKVSVEKDRNVLDATMVAEIDRTMKKHADDLLNALEGISARLTQLETRTRHLENSVDDLQVSVGNNHGSNDGKMRQLENILREVHSTVRDVRDNQDKVEAQLHLVKLQISDPGQHSQKPNTDTVQQTPPPQQILAPQVLPAPPSFPSPFGSHHLQPNQPPAPPHHQNSPPQIPNQYSQNQIPSDPQRDPYYQPGPTKEPQPHQYVLPPTQQQQIPPQEPQPQQYLLPPTQQQQIPPHVAPPSHQQYQPSVHQQYSQPPPQPSPQPQLSLSQIPDEMSYPSSQTYPPNVRQHPSHSTNTAPPHQQFYGGAPPHKYEPSPSGRPNSGFSPGYSPQTGSNEPYSYSGPSQYSGTLKPQGSGGGGGSGSSGGYPQLPTARLLPQALPTASAANPSSGSSGTGNRVPVDDVVDKVTTMGFPRDVVRATVRKLTENGQAVDLNIVLDKLMNDGDIQQPPKGWFGR